MSIKKRALFVCLGNTCRSPIAEAVFLHQITQDGHLNNWEVDSAGIKNWHAGDFPNTRARNTLQQHNILHDHRARQIKKEDYNKFDYIFGMDDYNVNDLRSQAPKGCTAKILLLGDFDPQGDRIIKDPYCDYGSEGFEKCFQQCMRSCRMFLDSLQS